MPPRISTHDIIGCGNYRRDLVGRNSLFRRPRIPMTKPICGDGSAFPVDEVSRVLGIQPGVNQVRARENFPHILTRAWIVNHGVTVLRETDAHYEMAAWRAAVSSQAVVAKR